MVEPETGRNRVGLDRGSGISRSPPNAPNASATMVVGLVPEREPQSRRRGTSTKGSRWSPEARRAGSTAAGTSRAEFAPSARDWHWPQRVHPSEQGSWDRARHHRRGGRSWKTRLRVRAVAGRSSAPGPLGLTTLPRVTPGPRSCSNSSAEQSWRNRTRLTKTILDYVR